MGPVTMKEIAERAGVSRPTVSRVLNNKASLVTEGTREKVLRIARELNYQPNFQAVNLKTKKSFLIGVNFPQGLHYSESSYLTRLQYGFSLVFDPTDYELVFHSSVLKKEEAFSMVRSNRIDGYLYVVYGSGAWFKGNMVPFLTEHTIPFVLIHDTSREGMDFPNVGYNSYQAAYQITSHLVKLGHQKLGFLGLGNPDEETELKQGCKKALTDNGFLFSEENSYGANFRFKPVGFGIPEFIFRELIPIRKGMPTAFVCASDYYAFNLIKEFNNKGLRVPEDVAVVSARSELTRYAAVQLGIDRTLTTMKQEVVEKGQRAAEMLLHLLENPDQVLNPQQVIIEPKLKIRGSCGAPII